MSPVDRHPPAGDDSLAQVLDRDRAAIGDLTGATLGDFHVERLLGRGGMGDVYLARQISLNRPVALKVLRADVLSKPGYVERFNAEAIAVARLNHPGIVHVYAISKIESVHFIAMEYVEGTNLRELVARRGALDLPQALSIMKQTAQALGAAGEAGIIHRDIKPENILITRRGRIKVADFGLCRQLDAEDVHLTQVGITMGTPAYMSPEQAQGHPLDHRSDLYSLGATFYYMLSATPPFKADSPVAMALKQVREIPSSLLVHRPDLPMVIDRLVMKLMAKNPVDRYQSAAEMMGDLARIRDVIQVSTTGTEAIETIPARAEAPSSPVPASPAIVPVEPRAQVDSARVRKPQRVKLAVAMVDDIGEQPVPMPRLRFNGLVATAMAAVALGAGGLAGWAARAPDIASLSDEGSRRPPALWIQPRWVEIPKEGGAEEQIQYARYVSPSDRAAAAWLAVPGYHSRSHDAVSRAYVQLARLWYRRGDVRAMEILGSELGSWGESQTRDKDLASLIRLALDLKKGDLGSVEKGFEGLARGELKDIYDASLVAFHLEVCADALEAVRRSGSRTIEQPLRVALGRLILQLNRIELGGATLAARGAHPGGGSAPGPGG